MWPEKWVHDNFSFPSKNTEILKRYGSKCCLTHVDKVIENGKALSIILTSLTWEDGGTPVFSGASHIAGGSKGQKAAPSGLLELSSYEDNDIISLMSHISTGVI